MKISRTNKMSKTSKRTKSSYMSKKISNTHTHSYNEQYNRLFAELGWMILAKTNGNDEEIHRYKMSLQRLRNSIKSQVDSLHNKYSKIRLKVLLINLEVLQLCVDKNL